MSNLPTYQQDKLGGVPSPTGNRGLWFSRFYDGFETDWLIDKDARSAWLRLLTGYCGDTSAITRATTKQMERAQALGGKCRVFKTEWSFVTGLGLSHPVENGFNWHHILGTPYLCGAGVKGLVRAWIEAEAGLEKKECEERVTRWFGSPDQAGSLIFLDALPIERPEIGPDVMTPHMGKWYERGGKISSIDDAQDTLPGDWHSPVPVEFLVTQRAKFLFSIAPRPSVPEAPVDEAMHVLEMALADLGAGAKTAVGYGGFLPDVDALERLETQLEENRQRADFQTRLEKMSPVDRRVSELVELAKQTKSPAETLLLASIESDSWNEEGKVKAAQRAKTIMEEQGRWLLYGNPKKNKSRKRTMAVRRILKEES